MRIYLSYRYRPYATAVYFERAFIKNHQVIYTGSSYGAKAGYPGNVNLHDLSSHGLPAPEFLFFVDPAGEFFPNGFEKLDCPTAIYLVDVHLDFDLRASMAPFFDYIFVAQKDYVERFQQLGFRQVHWLPFACDMEIHGYRSLQKEWDIGFVGHVHSPERVRRLKLLASRYRMNDYWKSYPKEQISEVYSRSKIVFNTSINGDLNMRVFEALASGSMLLTDRIANGQSDLFKPGLHLVEYSDDRNLFEQIDYYLNHPEEREKIASQGCLLVAQQHTYGHRVETILDTVFSRGGPQLTAQARNMRPSEVRHAYSRIYTRFQMSDALLDQFRLAWGMHHGYAPILGSWFGVLIKRLYRSIRYPSL
jgi:hypothetical protein